MQLTNIALPTLVLTLSLFNTSFAAPPLQEECDGEIKTCCIANEEPNSAAMWVKVSSCPRGMSDNATCPLEYGCKAITSSSPP